ncbi:MAG: ribbon-helix-helix protein, CopG family [Gemmatimonadaceae bacterium]|nr:ribbon-helix-helix protein, CopG family [Gemmatimonadaceae bacterium]
MTDPVFIGAKVPQEFAAAVRVRAQRTDRTVSAMIRIALAEHLTNSESAPAQDAFAPTRAGSARYAQE